MRLGVEEGQITWAFLFSVNFDIFIGEFWMEEGLKQFNQFNL